MILIAAADENWAIGKNGDQLIYLKDDLKRFRELTMGKTVILGRKTLAALPGGKPLKGREHLVLSADPRFSADGAKVFHDLDTLLAYAPENSVVIGGGTVYEALLPYCTAAYITKIHAAFDADTWFPNLDEHPDWELAEESAPPEQEGFSYHYAIYRKKDN